MTARRTTRARRRHLRAALDELAEVQGVISDEEIERLIAEARKRSIITRPRGD